MVFNGESREAMTFLRAISVRAFGDMDINQDGIVTTRDLQRIIEREHDVYSNRP